MEDLELLSFNIISAVGTAKSRYVQAMYLAEKGDFDEARAKIMLKLNNSKSSM